MSWTPEPQGKGKEKDHGLLRADSWKTSIGDGIAIK